MRSLHLQRESSFLNKYMFAVVDKHLWKFQDNKKKKPGKPRTTVISAGYNLKRWKLRLNLQNRLTVWVKGVELLVLCVISIKCITFCFCPNLVSARVIVDKVETFSRRGSREKLVKKVANVFRHESWALKLLWLWHSPILKRKILSHM